MREIKFRGKRVDNGEWLYGDLMTYDNDYVICDVDDGGYLPIIRETVGQFTGLFDKNGKEIYEGDILDDSETELNYVIEFMSGEFIGINEEYGIGRIILSLSEEGKVLGNIHDNKELLND